MSDGHVAAAPASAGAPDRVLENQPAATTTIEIAALTELLGDAVTYELNQLTHTTTDNPQLTRASIVSRGLAFVRSLFPCTRKRSD